MGVGVLVGMIREIIFGKEVGEAGDKIGDDFVVSE
jgi:hypothetical protein